MFGTHKRLAKAIGWRRAWTKGNGDDVYRQLKPGEPCQDGDDIDPETGVITAFEANWKAACYRDKLTH